MSISENKITIKLDTEEAVKIIQELQLKVKKLEEAFERMAKNAVFKIDNSGTSQKPSYQTNGVNWVGLSSITSNVGNLNLDTKGTLLERLDNAVKLSKELNKQAKNMSNYFAAPGEKI